MTWNSRLDITEALEAAGWTGEEDSQLGILDHPSGAQWAVLNDSGDCALDCRNGVTVEFPGETPGPVVIAACLAASGQLVSEVTVVCDVELPPFSGDVGRCPKCFYNELLTHYRPPLPANALENFNGASRAGPLPERLERECFRCDFTWDEALPNRVAGDAQADGCPHCPDGHTPPDGGSQPWAAWVSEARDGDGQPTTIHVARSAGAHVAESDAQWVRDRLNGEAR